MKDRSLCLWVPKTYARGIAVESVQLIDGIGGSARAFMGTWTDGLCRGGRLVYQRDDGPMTRANGHPTDGTVGTPRPFGNRSGGTPLVVSRETADIGELDDLPEFGRLYWAMVG